jgi:hypothetical protein
MESDPEEKSMLSRPAWLLAVPFLLGLAAPARAQWSPVKDVQGFNIFAVRSQGDTILAGADSSVFISTNAGLSFTQSAKPAFGTVSVGGLVIRNGRIYAGTFGQGVFVSDNLGATWTAFNQGLTGGFLESQLDVLDLEVRSDTLFAATGGAGVYARALAPGNTWHHFGEIFEGWQASTVVDLALGGSRLLASGGANGMVFRRDPGQPEWIESFLKNVGLFSGVGAQMAEWTGSGWVVGTNIGPFWSTAGQEPWTRVNLAIGAIDHSAFTTTGSRLFGAFSVAPGCVIESSPNNGVTWEFLEFLPGVFTYALAQSHGTIYAGRLDGLWRRDNPNLAVEPGAARGLGFALEGAQPVRGSARLRFELAQPEVVEIATYDVRGRIAGARVRETMPAGVHSIAVSLEGLPPGVYAAQLVAGARREAVRLVHVK